MDVLFLLNVMGCYSYFYWLCLNKIYALTGRTLLIAAILVSLVVFYKQIPRRVKLFSSIFLLSFVISLVVEFWPSIWQWSTMNHEILRNIALSTIAILGGPFVVWRTYLFQKDIALKAENTNIADRNSFNGIFTKAIEQLGAFKGEDEPNLNVRIGAIYALEKLSQANINYYQVIIDILCSYVRENSPVSLDNPQINDLIRIDVETAITVIGRRKRLKNESTLNLSLANFTGANMQNGDFRSTVFSLSNFNHASLRLANLEGTVFTCADLDKADLRDAKNLTCEKLSRARNWQQAYRDPELACGASIPTPPGEDEK